MAIQGKICPKCHKPTQRLIVKSRVESSEDYCPVCHKSYPLSSKEIMAMEGEVSSERE